MPEDAPDRGSGPRGQAYAGGFSPAATRFFEDLEEDNSREFWTAHVEAFEREVKGPMAALLESLPEAYQPFRVFRMNRDLRFTTDKSPYKTQHSAIHGSDGIDYYLQVGAGGLLAASGIYAMERDQLERYRAAVDDTRKGRALERALALLADDGRATDGIGEPLKTAPRGFARDHPRVDLLRRKGVVAHDTLVGAELADAGAIRDFVVRLFESAEPVNTWLRKHVGPAAERSRPGRS